MKTQYFIILLGVLLSCKKENPSPQNQENEPITICENSFLTITKKEATCTRFSTLTLHDTLIYCFDSAGNLLGVDKYRDPRYTVYYDYNSTYQYDESGLIDTSLVIGIESSRAIFVKHFERDEVGQIRSASLVTTKFQSLIATEYYEYDQDGNIKMMHLEHPGITNNFSNLVNTKFFWTGNLVDSMYIRPNSVATSHIGGYKFFYSNKPNVIKDQFFHEPIGISGGNSYSDFLVDSVIIYPKGTNDTIIERYTYQLDANGRVIERYESTQDKRTFFDYE